MTQVWIWGPRYIHSLLMNIFTIYFGQPSAPTGALPSFLHEGPSVAPYGSSRALCPAISKGHFYTSCVLKESLITLDHNYPLQDHCRSRKHQFARVARYPVISPFGNSARNKFTGRRICLQKLGLRAQTVPRIRARRTEVICCR
jgi:hypothetical protein